MDTVFITRLKLDSWFNTNNSWNDSQGTFRITILYLYHMLYFTFIISWCAISVWLSCQILENVSFMLPIFVFNTPQSAGTLRSEPEIRGTLRCLPQLEMRPSSNAPNPVEMNKDSGGDGIPVELLQILKDDVVKVLHSILQQIWKTQQGP